jgi:hypothetical protein
MPERSRPAWVDPLARLAALTLLALLLAGLGRAALAWDALFPDVICYWTAGKSLAAGQSPYDPGRQARIQQEYGWDKETTGRGTYDFLPYYYPPWFGLLWVLLVPLGYEGAKFAWFFLNVELSLVTGYLLRHNLPGVAPRIPMVLVPVCAFTLACVLLGQTTMLVFFLITLSWSLLRQHRDGAAGVALAWLTIKPQLTAVLLLGILIWLVRQRRWRAVQTYFATLALFCLVCTLIVPSWPIEMWEAPRQTPSPTEHYPWIGNTWFLLLKALGLQGWALWGLYLAGALAFLTAVLRTALDRGAALSDLLGWGILAAFFVAPYARHYDFPVLLIPALLLGNRLPQLASAGLIMALVVVPYVQFFLLTYFKALSDPGGPFLLEATFFWVPALLAVLWLIVAGRQRQARPHPLPVAPRQV